jgi:hypothetical protein
METFDIILQTASEIAKDYPNGWIGDANDFTQVSASVSQELTNRAVERLWDEFANGELLANGVTFTFSRQGREKLIKVEQTVKKCPPK